MRQLIFRRNYYTGLARLEPAKRLECYDAIMRYAFDGEMVDVSPECVPVLYVIYDSMNIDFRKYEQRVKGAKVKR